MVDPRKSPSVRQGADLHRQIRIGTNVALMNGLIHPLLREGRVDHDFVAAHTAGFEKMQAVVAEYPPERMAKLCGIVRADLERTAQWIGTTQRIVSTVLQGFYQSVEATASPSPVNSVHLGGGGVEARALGRRIRPGAMCATPNSEATQPERVERAEVCDPDNCP